MRELSGSLYTSDPIFRLGDEDLEERLERQRSASGGHLAHAPGDLGHGGKAFTGSRLQSSLIFTSLILATLSTVTLEAQMIDRPGTVWGQVDHQPEGLVIGGVETLAGSLIAQLVTLAAIIALVLRKRALMERIELARVQANQFEFHRLAVKLGRVRTLLAIAVYGVSPLLASVSILLGGPHAVVGLHAPILAIGLFALTCAAAAADIAAS